MSDELPPYRPRGPYKGLDGTDKRRAYSRDYYRKNRAKLIARSNNYWAAMTPERRRKFHLYTRYGLTLEEYEAMFEAQGRRCASCGDSNPPVWKKLGQWAVDHDHNAEGMKIRAILCHPCNTTLGHHKDCPDRLMRVALYAERHK